MGQRADHTRTSDRQEFHLFRNHPARSTGDTVPGEANHCRMLPPQKVPDLLDLVVIPGKALFSTRAALKGHLFPFERQNDRSFLCFDVDEAKVWKAKKSREKLIRHLVGSPCCHLSMNTRKMIPHLMFFLPTLSRCDTMSRQRIVQKWTNCSAS